MTTLKSRPYGIKQYSKLNVRTIASVIVLLILVVSVWSVYFDDYRIVRSTDIKSTDTCGELLRDQEVSQTILCDRDGLKDIRVYFATYARTNVCSLVASLHSDGQIVQVWNIDGKLLQDNAYYTLMLERAIPKSAGKTYLLAIRSDGEPGNAVTIYKNTSGEYSGLALNKTRQEGESLCYRIEYQTRLDNIAFKYILRFLIVCAAALAAFVFSSVFKCSVLIQFLLLWIPLSGLFACSNTPLNVPDERSHFYRAYEVSTGHWTSEYLEDSDLGGRSLPLDVDLDLLHESWQSYDNNKDLNLTEHSVFKEFATASLYAPISYLPQAVGIYIGRHLTRNIPVIFYAGRIVNWLCITLLLSISIGLIPYGKEFIILVALMPMNIHEAFSLAPDGMVVAITTFMIAFVLYCIESLEASLRPYQIIILYALAFIASLYKIVYVPFCLYYILIPANKFRHGIKEKMTHALLILTGVCVLSLSWLQSCSKFLNHKGSDSAIQLSYLLHHPGRYYITLCRTIMSLFSREIFRMVGESLAWLNVSTVGIFVLAYIVMLVYKINGKGAIAVQKQRCNSGLRLISGAVVVSILVLIYTSLYLQWNEVYSSFIYGVQGRYFIALLLPGYLVFTKKAYIGSCQESIGYKSKWLVMLINVCACISLLFACLNVNYQ